MKMRGESLSDTDSDWPRLEQLVLVYGGLQWSSDWIPGVKFPKQINKMILTLILIIVKIPKQITKMKKRGESLSDTDIDHCKTY